MNKKIISLILCAILVLSLIPLQALAAESELYLVLGDSISTGYGLAEDEPSFVDILVADNGYALDNQAVDGNTAAGILAQFSGNGLDAAITDAELITITIGGNDLMDQLYTAIADSYNAENEPDITPDDVPVILSNSDDSRWMTLLMCGKAVLEGDNDTPAFAETDEFNAKLEEFIQNLNSVTSYIRGLNPSVTLIVTTQYNPYKHFSGMYAVINTGIGAGAKKLSEAIIANAEAGDYLVADVYTAFENSSETLTNPTTSPINLDFHPNAAGHAVIAQVIQQVLDSIVPEEPDVTDPTEPEEDPCAAFTDIDRSRWYHEAVDYVIENGLMNGVSDTEFAPNGTTSRAMIATILWRHAGKPAAGGGQSVTFSDVPANKWYTEAIEWCAANDIVNGYTDGTFGPTKNITREQLATMLCRYAGYLGQDTSADAGTLDAFADAASVSKFARNSMAWAIEHGIINGVNEDTLDPKGQATRAQTAAMIMRLLEQ